MRAIVHLLRREPRARRFFAVHAQSSLGTGAGYAALLLLAYGRWHSPLAISLVLAADLVPSMALGPLFGAAADRWSRRRCMVTADVLRAVAFLGLPFVHGIGATVALALVAGAGTGLFGPAALASLPSLVERRRVAAANGLFAAVADLGWALGPALAALGLLFAGPDLIVAANGLTFAVSAAVLARLRFGDAPTRPAPARRPSLLRETREGLRASARLPGVPVVLAASTGVLLFAGMFNVAELPYASGTLGVGDSGFALLLAAFALGMAGGSLAGVSGRAIRARYLTGLCLVAVGFAGAAAAPALGTALLAFTLAGRGNGLVVVHERLLIQEQAPDAVLGRVFGVKDALTAWAFAVALLAGAPLVALLGARGTVAVSAAGAAVVAALAATAMIRPRPSAGRLGIGPA